MKMNEKIGLVLMIYGLMFLIVIPNSSFPWGGALIGAGAGILLFFGWIDKDDR